MSIFRSEIQFQKFINWVGKIATLIVSAPATISVARRAYPDVTGVVQWVVIGACVVLVEAAFVYFWIRVETRTGNIVKDEQLQAGSVLGCWLMYGVLLYAGILHGEGFLTLLFRASIGLLLFIATRDRLVQTKVKIGEMIANGSYHNDKVSKKQRQADERVALARIEKDLKLRLSLIQNDSDGVIERLAKENVAAMMSVQEQSIPKIIKPKSIKRSNMLENDYYRIEPIDDEFQVSCKMCKFTALKPSRKVAALAGNSHQRMHTNGHKQSVSMFVTESND